MIYVYVSDYDPDGFAEAVGIIESRHPGAVMGRTYRRLNAQIYTDGAITPDAEMVLIRPRYELLIALAQRIKQVRNPALEIVILSDDREDAIPSPDPPAERRGPGRPPKAPTALEDKVQG